MASPRHPRSVNIRPRAESETQALLGSGRAGASSIKKCGACGEVHYYPRALCPFCGSDRTDWQPARRGIVYSWRVMRRAETPYAIAYVPWTRA